MKIVAILVIAIAFLANFFRVDKFLGMDVITWGLFQGLVFGGAVWLYLKLIRRSP